MEWTDNFSELILLSERPVYFYFNEKIISMKIPNIIDCYTDHNIQYAIAITNMDINEIKQYVKNIDFNNLWELLKLMILNKENNKVINSIKYLFQFCFGSNFIINNKWFLDMIEIDVSLFNRIIEIIQISNGLKKFTEQNKFQINKPDWLIQKEREIKRIKNQNQSTSESNIASKLIKIFITLNYEFNYTFEELCNMNYYHIQILHSYIPKVIQYDIHKHALSAGTKKKIKYITE